MMFQKNMIGIIGLVIALAGVGVAIFQDDLRPAATDTPVELKDRVIEAGAELLGVEVERKGSADTVRIVQFALGFLAIVLGVISWVRKEDHRMSSVPIALGIIVVAWEYVLIGVGVAVVVMILGSLGFS